jgi:dipeptide/tripeptide permease
MRLFRWPGDVSIPKALDPLIVLIFILHFDQVIYPFLEKHGVAMKEIRRLILGMLLSSTAFFFISGLLQLSIDKRITSGSITSYINIISDSKLEN